MAVNNFTSTNPTKNNLTVAFAGNPNVGKSTLFNALTGLKQHTGNWAGKTVGNASGEFKTKANKYTLVDIPGTYSLISRSKEEEIARDFILFGDSDTVVVVCDATSLERNLNLVLQIREIHPKCIVCVNLLDEAKLKGIKIDLKGLEESLCTPVVGLVARNKKTIGALGDALDNSVKSKGRYLKTDYPLILEEAISLLKPCLKRKLKGKLNYRWLSISLLQGDKTLISKLNDYYEINIEADPVIKYALKRIRKRLKAEGVDLEYLTACAFVEKAESIAEACVISKGKRRHLDESLDKLFTGKVTGYLTMIAFLSLILWLTVTGANYLSDGLNFLFVYLEKGLGVLLDFLKIGDNLQYFIFEGLLRVPLWVVAVMLPPMAIFFPLFTFLEDLGYLPRVAFNLDKPFMKCKSCGKQALTMCMGFGCNAVGVTGCRIIDSKRERLLATVTNSFVPCNGRFPTITSLISAFLVTATGILGGVYSAFLLTLVLLLGVGMTFLSTKLLSQTLLKGYPSAYTLELPSFRKPQIFKTIIRSILDRTVFVLARAVTVAIPAGIVIFALSNITVSGQTLLIIIADFLDPLGRFMGLDGIILLGFILGFPANEIVIPIILMGYLSGGSLTDVPDIALMREILISNGWTVNTALCTVIFSLFHWPCSTTLLTVKKETGSLKWTAVSAVLPTLIGFILCVAITFCFKIFD